MKHALAAHTVALLCTTCLQPIFHELYTYIRFLKAYVVGQKVSQSLEPWTLNLSCSAPFLLYFMKPHLKYKEVNEVRVEKVGKFYQPSPT